MREDPLLPRIASRGLERIARVLAPPSRKVATIVRIAPAVQSDLVAVVELRDPARREQEGVREQQSLVRGSGSERKPVQVVIVRHRHQPLGVVVEPVAAERLCELTNRRAPHEHAAHRRLQGEVEDLVDSRAHPIEVGLCPLEERDHRGVLVEHLTDDGQARVLALDRRHPRPPERPRHVDPGVLTDRIDPGDAGPPERVLYQVARHFGIALVEVRQDVGEPAEQRGILHRPRPVGIREGVHLPVVREMSRWRAREPGGRGWVLRPDVLGSRVVRHHVHHDLHAERMCVIDQSPVRREVSEVLLDGIEIGRTVPVVVGVSARRPVPLRSVCDRIDVVVDRGQPDRGDAEVFQVWQTLTDSFDVTPMIVAGIVAPGQTCRSRGIVVRSITIGEPVGHDQIEHVPRTDALEAAGAVERRVHDEVELRAPPVGPQRDRIRPGRRTGRHGDVHEQIRPRATDLHVAARERAAVHARTGERAPAHEQPDGIDRVPDPPAGRVDLGDRWRGGRRERRRGEQQRQQRQRGRSHQVFLTGAWPRAGASHAPDAGWRC